MPRLDLLMQRAAAGARARPWLKKALFVVLAPFPGLRWRLRARLVGRFRPQGAAAAMPGDLDDLPPRARRIYIDLKAALSQRQEDRG